MRVLVCAVAALLLIAESPLAATGDPAVDALIDKLVEKRILTGDDARELEKDLKKPADDRNGSFAESRSDTAKEPSKESSKQRLPFEIKVRAQTRLDAGDLLVGPGGDYKTESDLFMRRVRLEVDKEYKNPPLGKELDLDITLDADRFDQDFRDGRRRDPGNRLNLLYIYGDWTFVDQFGLKVGKHKLPFLRIELTSSARQLLIERPVVTGAAKDTFGDYKQPQINAHGKMAGGAVGYYFAYADGAANLDALEDLDRDAASAQRRRWGNAFIGRVEISPFGLPGGGAFTEKKKDDTGIGAGNHLTVGLDGGLQRDIRYATASVSDAGLDTSLISVDLAGRYRFGATGTLTGQMAYINFRRDFSYRGDERPQGGYIQAGYLLPWTLWRGSLEPAARYEVFEHDRIENEGESGGREKTYAIGLNHYLLKHSIKWSYNFVHTRFDRGVAEALNSRERDMHQLMLQLYL